MATDPYRSYNFKLVMNGVAEGHFTECSGLMANSADIAPVTLRYGVTTSRALWDWLLTAVNGKVEPKNVSIILLDGKGADELGRWHLNNAWPSEWQGAGLNTTDRAVAVDSLTLVFDSLERA